MVRIVTGILMAATLLLALTWPLELKNKPDRNDPLRVRQAFAARLAWHTGSIVLCLLGAGVGGILISRQAKREYRNASLRNLKNLVEGKPEEE